MTTDGNIKDHVLMVVATETAGDGESEPGQTFPGGEINTVSNLSDFGLFKEKVGSDLQFRGINTETPSGIEIKYSGDGDTLLINYIGGGGGTADPTFNSVTFSTTDAPDYVDKLLFWDDAKHCPAFYNDRTAVTMQIGRELWRRIENETGDDLSDGMIVRVSGWGTDSPTVSYASNNIIGDVESVLAVMTEIVIDTESGEATRYGEVNGIDTLGETSGKIVYLGLGGAWTTTRPVAPDYTVRIGTIGKVDEINGSILVDIVGFNSTDTDVNSVGMLNGIAPQRQSITTLVTGSPVTIYCDVINAQVVGTNLPVIIGGVRYDLNTTSGAGAGGSARVAITPGGSNAPLVNWVYVEIVGGVAVLKSSTTYPSAFPLLLTDIVVLAFVSVLDTASTTADGPFAYQRWNNSVDNGPGDGFIQYVTANARQRGATWQQGVDPTVTLAGTTPTAVNVTTSPGLVWQMHAATVDATDGTEYFVLNAPTEMTGGPAGIMKITDLNQITHIADGTALVNNDMVNLELIGGQMSETVPDRMFINLPKGVYKALNGAKFAVADSLGYAVTSVSTSTGLRTTAFRDCGLVLRYKTGNTWENVVDQEYGELFLDRRGLALGATGGGGGGGGSDPSAVHVNIAGEINGIAPKASPVADDIILIEDSEDSYSKKSVAVTNLNTPDNMLVNADTLVREVPKFSTDTVFHKYISEDLTDIKNPLGEVRIVFFDGTNNLSDNDLLFVITHLVDQKLEAISPYDRTYISAFFGLSAYCQAGIITSTGYIIINSAGYIIQSGSIKFIE